VAETFISVGIRPIAVSYLEIFGTILNGRPISASRYVMDSSIPGQCPVIASERECCGECGGEQLKTDRNLGSGRLERSVDESGLAHL
jgi:hypothetical protein